MQHLTENEIEKTYNIIKKYHAQYLNSKGVKLPSLKNNSGEYSKNALTLIYLAYNYPNTKCVSKKELTDFIRIYYPDTNDVQQARHLGAQEGWYIISGARNSSIQSIPYGHYKLISLETEYPGFKKDRRVLDIDDWDALKKSYNYRCATCGSKEGEPHLHWPDVITKLQKGHMDPNKPLEKGNIIPQCQICNRADRDRWVYDEKGRVIAVANANVILCSNDEVKEKAYALLYNLYNGKKPKNI